eukprot:COSAG02_NODE_240_length_27672_cov_67.291445_16_plen_404_part_00
MRAWRPRAWRRARDRPLDTVAVSAIARARTPRPSPYHAYDIIAVVARARERSPCALGIASQIMCGEARLRRVASHLELRGPACDAPSSPPVRPAALAHSWVQANRPDSPHTASGSALTAEQIAQFKRDGFVNGGTLLTDAELEELTQALTNVLDAGVEFYDVQPEFRRPVLFHPFFGTGHQIVNLFEASEPFRRLLYHPTIVQAVQQLMECRELFLWHDQLLSKPPVAGEALQWHQDAPLWPILDPAQSHSMVSVWIPFDDADESNGTLHMVPGSHLWGDQMEYLRGSTQSEHNESQSALGIQHLPGGQVVRACPVRLGEVHFHHALTWHSSGRNSSGRARRAHALHYMPSDTRYIAAKEHVMKQHVECADGGTMSAAGPHFPRITDDVGQIVYHKNEPQRAG